MRQERRALIDPVATDDDRFYFDGLAQGLLLVQRCLGCGRLRHPPTPWCPSCRDPDWEAQAVSGEGSIHSYVIPRKPALENILPSPVIVLVELVEGVRIVSNLVGVDPAAVRFDMPVRLDFMDVAHGVRLPVFRPSAAG